MWAVASVGVRASTLVMCVHVELTIWLASTLENSSFMANAGAIWSCSGEYLRAHWVRFAYTLRTWHGTSPLCQTETQKQFWHRKIVPWDTKTLIHLLPSHEKRIYITTSELGKKFKLESGVPVVQIRSLNVFLRDSPKDEASDCNEISRCACVVCKYNISTSYQRIENCVHATQHQKNCKRGGGASKAPKTCHPPLGAFSTIHQSSTLYFRKSTETLILNACGYWHHTDTHACQINDARERDCV